MRGLHCLEAMLEAKENIVAVVGHAGSKSDVLARASEVGIDTYDPRDVNSPDFVQEMRKYEADLFVLSGYNKIFKHELINLPTKGCINLHGGKLPEYRGCAPINWQIINGEKVGGCCVLYVDEGIDTGDVINQVHYEIFEKDTSQDVIKKQLKLFPSMLLEAISSIKNDTVKAIRQDLNIGNYYTRRYPRDGLIKWKEMTALQVYNLVRSLVDPYPNAFTYCGNEIVKVRKVERISPPIIGVPGRLSMKTDEGIIICCKDEAILVTEVIHGNSSVPSNPNNLSYKIGSDF